MILISTQCFPPELGGIQTTMAALATYLSRAGWRVRVYADGLEPEVRPTRYRTSRFGGPRIIRKRMKSLQIAWRVARGGVDGVFADSWKSLESLPKLYVPVAVFAHGAELPENPTPAKRARIVRALSKARSIIANSRYTAERVRDYLPDAGDKIVIITPTTVLPPPPSDEAVAEIAALREGRGPVLSTLTRLEPRKGVDSVLRALAALAPAHPRLIYLVAGGGEDLERLRAIARDLDVERHVTFLGRVDDDQKAALLAATDLFVMPVRKVGASVEGFGMSYIEAAIYGAPSVAGAEGGAADAVLDGVTGLVCDGADQDAVTAAIAALLDDPARRTAMGEAAAARVRAELLWDDAAPRYLAALGLTALML